MRKTGFHFFAARSERPASAMPQPSGPRGLIVTADDFGLHEAVNEAIERAHWDGVLTATSLMVGAPAAADAIARARRMPRLRVGLHIVLADGAAVLPRAQIPDLVDPAGRFGEDMARDGFRFFFLPAVRRQLAAEIEAQFALFQASGLPLDHVNAHKHFHLHPTVLSLILATRRRFRFHAMRLPLGLNPPMFLRPWLALMRRRLDRANIAHNDRICGIEQSGAMDESALLAALGRLPAGVTEIYLHPATQGGITRSMASYRPTDELAALLSPRVRDAMDSLGVKRGGFSDFWPVRGAA
jgi:chitin disaccharide deacetylase